VVAERAAGVPYSVEVKDIEASIVAKASKATPKDPVGVLGEGAIAFGVRDIFHSFRGLFSLDSDVRTQGGAVMTKVLKEQLKESDPLQLVNLG
jgi:hypothetical protein